MELEKYKKKLHSRGLGRFFQSSGKKNTEEVKQEPDEKVTIRLKNTPDDSINNLEKTAGDTEVDQLQTTITQMALNENIDSVQQIDQYEEDYQSDQDNSKPQDEISPRDKGIPLRLHKGKVQRKSKKFMSSQDLRKREESSKRRSKRMKTQNNKIDDHVVVKSVNKPTSKDSKFSKKS